MFTKHYLLLLLILSSIIISCNSGKIFADIENKIQMVQPNKDVKNQKLMINFQLSTNLLIYQYIGVKFPDNLSNVLNFNLANQLSCSIKRISDQKNIQSTATVSIEPNIAFCQLTDTNNIISSKEPYLLSLTISNAILTNFVNSLSIFTATDINLNRVIIDSNIFFAEFGMYPDLSNQVKPPLEITATVFSPTVVKILTIFDLTITFTVNSFISKSSRIMIKWPSDLVTAPYACLTFNAADNDTSKAKLAGNINCVLFNNSPDTIIIRGSTTDLVPGRQFNIVLKGMQALDKVPTNPGNLEAFVYYQNSYSVFSYSKKSSFTITKSTIAGVTIRNPDDWDIYQGSAWPLKFTFSSDVTFNNGGYIVVQHNNYSTTSKWNFISSTCDFSGNDASFSMNLGQRPICAPLDKNSFSIGSSGNAMFFKMPSITADKPYTFTVFGFAEVCGSTPYANEQDHISQFSFQISVYKNIDMTASGDKIFNYPSNVLLSQSASTITSTLCYNNNQLITHGNTSSYYQNKEAASSVDAIILNEIHNFSFGSYSTSCSETTTCYNSDIVANILNYNQGYIYTNDLTTTLAGGYFSIKADIAKNSMDAVISTVKSPLVMHLVALPVFYDVDDKATINTQPGKIILKWNKRWFQTGDDKSCFASWGGAWEVYNPTAGTFSIPTGATASTQKVVNNITNDSKNFITQTGDTPSIDAAATVLNPDKGFTVTSIADGGNGFTAFKFLSDYKTGCGENITCSHYNLSVLSTCVKWVDNLPNTSITSQYTYFDFQLNTIYTATNIANRINRFFKFVTNPVGMLDPTTKVKNYDFANILTYHVAIFPSNEARFNNAICLIQINKDNILASMDQDTNTLAVYLNNLVPLDMDYSLLTSNYPSVPADGSVKVYSFPALTSLTTDTNLLFNRYETYQSRMLKYQSTYYTYLSPVIMFMNYNKFYLTSDILIPVYCPNTTQYSVSLALLKSNKNSFNFNKISSVISMPNATGNTYDLQIRKSNNNKGVITSMFNKNTSIMFGQYTTADNNLYFYNTSTNDMKCTGYSLLLNSINTNEGESGLKINTTPVTNLKVYTINKNFYAFDRLYTGVMLAITPTALTIKSDVNQATPGNLFGGLVRPGLDTFIENSSLASYNRLSFFCTSSSDTDTNFMSNMDSGKFILDFNSDNRSSAWTGINISNDYSQLTYINDPAANLALNLIMPFSVSPNLQILLEIKNINYANAITNNTFCNSKTAYSIKKCVSNVNKNKISIICSLNEASFAFDIICYNLYISSDTFNVTNLSLVLPTKFSDKNIMTNSYINDKRLIYFNSNYSTAVDLKVNSQSNSIINYGVISKIDYFYSTQENSIGKINFTIDLPRKLVRGSKIVFDSDFSKFLTTKYDDLNTLELNNFIPLKCNVNFGTQDDQTNSLLESCDVSAIKMGRIIITTKSIIFLTQFNFAQKISVSLFPLLITDLSGVNSTLKYSIQMRLSNDDIISNTNTIPLQSTNINYFTKFRPIIQILSLCDVYSIMPKITNEFIEITFGFNFRSNSNIFNTIERKNYPPNEYLVYLNENDITISDYIICKSADGKIDDNYIFCNKLDDNILQIRTTSEVVIDSQQIYLIKVSGVKIRNGISRTYSIMCSFNNINYRGDRVSLIQGTGLFIQTRSLSDPFTAGGLQINSIWTDKITPRTLSKLVVRFSFVSALTSAVASLTNNPYVLLTLPDSLSLKNYRYTTQPDCVMQEYTGDLAQRNPAGKVFDTLPCILIGGSGIYIQFKEENRVVPPNIRFYEIAINNLYSPSDNLITLGQFQIALSNSNFSYVYKSYSNLSTLSFNRFKKPYDNFITSYRSFDYNFENNNLYILQIVDPNTDNINNVLIKPGRYMKYMIKLRPSTLNIELPPPDQTLVQLNDILFGIYEISINFDVNEGSSDFNIGTPCNRFPGTYYSHFSVSNIKSFYPVIPFTIKVDDTLGNIMVVPPLNKISLGSVSLIVINLSEPSYETLNVSFAQDPQNDPRTSISSNVTIPPFNQNAYARFVVGMSISSNKQIYNMNVNNICYQLNSNNLTLEASVDHTDTTATEVKLTTDNFIILQSTNTSINSIKIGFKPPLNAGYIACILQCRGAAVLSDDDLIQSFSVPLTRANTPLRSSFSQNFSSSDTIFMSFNNLIRGEKYLLKCVLEYENILPSPKIRKSIVFDRLSTSSGALLLEVASPQPTQCVLLNFLEAINYSIMLQMTNFCQKLFNPFDGCLLCVDNYGTMPDQKLFPSVDECGYDGLGSKNLLKFDINSIYNIGDYLNNNYISLFYAPSPENSMKNQLSINSTVYQTTNPASFPYYLCIVQNKLCSTNLETNQVTNLVTKLMNNLSNKYNFFSNFGLPQVPIQSASVVTDLIAPDIKNLSNYIVGTPYYDKTGYYNIKLYYKSPLICFWSIISRGQPTPNQNDIENCTNPNLCGNININEVVNDIYPSSITSNWKKGVYDMYTFCYNDLPYRVNYSQVITLVSLNIDDTPIKEDPDDALSYPLTDAEKKAIFDARNNFTASNNTNTSSTLT